MIMMMMMSKCSHCTEKKMQSVEVLNVVCISKFVLLLKISFMKAFLFLFVSKMSWNNIDLVYGYKLFIVVYCFVCHKLYKAKKNLII